MQRKRLLIGLIVSLFAMFLFACGGGGGGGGGGHGRISGKKLITSLGGAGLIAAPGGLIVIIPQKQGQISSGGGFNVPPVTMPAGATIIAADTVWSGAINGPITAGFKINAGVTVMVSNTIAPINIGVDGPVVIAGKIVPAATNTGPIGVSISTAGPTGGPIVLTGSIDASGPDNAAGSGVPGGTVFLANSLPVDNTFGIYIAGPISANGGNATGAAGNGGSGGPITIVGGDNEDILIKADLETNGGSGAVGVGAGALGGPIAIYNNTNDGTDADEGGIFLYDVKRVDNAGGEGVNMGGPGGPIQLTSDIGGWDISAPIFNNGGEATGSAPGVGGPGGGVMVVSDVTLVELLENADIKITDDIWGYSGGGLIGGGPSGPKTFTAVEGNLYIDGVIDVSGGLGTSTTAGQGGGNGGTVTASVADNPATPENFSIAIREAVVNGGDGGDKGGNAGVITQMNPTLGYIYLGPHALSVVGGDGITTDGAIGIITLMGYTETVGHFPSYTSLP